MATQHDEEIIYEYIKANFTAADGQATVLLIDQNDFRKSKVEIYDSILQADAAITDTRSSDLPYAVVSNFKGFRELYFSGTTFRREENLDNENITYYRNASEDKINLDKVREEFLRLGELLRKSERF